MISSGAGTPAHTPTLPQDHCILLLTKPPLYFIAQAIRKSCPLTVITFVNSNKATKWRLTLAKNMPMSYLLVLEVLFLRGLLKKYLHPDTEMKKLTKFSSTLVLSLVYFFVLTQFGSRILVQKDFFARSADHSLRGRSHVDERRWSYDASLLFRFTLCALLEWVGKKTKQRCLVTC